MPIRFEASADFQQLIAENAKYQKSLVTLTEKVEKLEKQAQQMAAAATKASQQFAAAGTPLGDYQRAVDKLSKQMAAGKINQQEFAAAVSEAGQKYDASMKSLGETSGAVEGHKGALSGLGSQVASLASGYVSWTAGLQLAGQALQFVQAETEKAKASQDSLVDARRNLVQVAKDEQDLAQMVARADAGAAKYGVDRNQAYQVLFNARSEGFEANYEDILASSQVIDPTAAAGVAGQVPALFAKTEKLTAEQAVSGTLLAAGESRLDFTPLARALPQAAEGGAIAGASFSETAATLSVLASRFKSGDTAAERIKQLATKLETKGVEGDGLIGKFETLIASGPEGIADFTGDSSELAAAVTIMQQELATIKTQAAKVQAEVDRVGAGGESMVDRQIGIAQSDPAEQARMNRVRAEIAREIANEQQFAREGSSRAAATDREMARLKEEDRAGILQFGVQSAGTAADFVGADTSWTQWAMRSMEAAMNPFAGYAKVSGAREETDRLRAETAEMQKRIAEERAAQASGQRIQEEQLEAIKQQTNVLQNVADRLSGPRSGASSAAAAPNVQRQGR
jgi:chromosome segregation ATPase